MQHLLQLESKWVSNQIDCRSPGVKGGKNIYYCSLLRLLPVTTQTKWWRGSKVASIPGIQWVGGMFITTVQYGNEESSSWNYRWKRGESSDKGRCKSWSCLWQIIRSFYYFVFENWYFLLLDDTNKPFGPMHIVLLFCHVHKITHTGGKLNIEL